MDELKTLNRLVQILENKLDKSMMEKIESIESEAERINDKLCKLFFNGDERFMKSFIKIRKSLKNESHVELYNNDVISIYKEWKEGKWMNRHEICFKYISNAEGSKYFRQIYSNIEDFDGHTPSFDETEPLLDKYDVIEQGRFMNVRYWM